MPIKKHSFAAELHSIKYSADAAADRVARKEPILAELHKLVDLMPTELVDAFDMETDAQSYSARGWVTLTLNKQQSLRHVEPLIAWFEAMGWLVTATKDGGDSREFVLANANAPAAMQVIELDVYFGDSELCKPVYEETVETREVKERKLVRIDCADPEPVSEEQTDASA